MGRQTRSRQNHPRRSSSSSCAWDGVPMDVAQLLLAHLSATDQRCLALACRAAHGWVAQRRASFHVPLEQQADLAAACPVLAKAPALRSLQLRRQGGLPPGAILLPLSLRCLRLPALSSLELFDISITARALGYLAHLPQLSALGLASSSSKRQHRLNADGCFAQLAACRALRRLAVTNIQSDRGLEAATQLTALDLSCPDHAPDMDELPTAAFLPYICPNCDEIHGEDIEELVHAQTDWQDETSLGLALHGLVGLRELVVDLRGEGSEINSTLNQLDLGPSGGTSLTGLTHLVLLNKSRAGYRAMLTAAFDSLPALQRLEVQFDSFPSLLSWPLSSKDAGGRELVLQGRNGQRWVLQRSLGPATAEE